MLCPGYGGCAPLGPVVAALVPRFALLPAPTPRLMGLRQTWTCQVPNRFVSLSSKVAVDSVESRGVGEPDQCLQCSQGGQHVAGGGGGKEGAAGPEGRNRRPPGGDGPPT